MNRYVLYARKSQEDQGRQQKSIEDQIQTLVGLAQRQGFVLVHTFREQMSAKEPYQRPQFDEMIALLQTGEADAILCYHVNRLARNMVEGGLLQHLLTKGVLKEIRTTSEVFRSGDNILPFILQTAMSTQYSLDLSHIVRDRIAAKVARGEYPQRAPEGYVNNHVLHRIDKDEQRFPLVKQAWELMATGTYSLEQMARVMNRDWGYTTRPAQKVGGGPMSKTSLHRLFRNVFYTGFFLRNGELHQGNHEPMIDWEIFDAVQKQLSRSGNPRAQHRGEEFAYTGLIVCGRCGRRITAEHKKGRHGRGDYTYYHCAHWRNCGEKAVRQEVIEAKVKEQLEGVAISRDMLPLCIEVIERIYQEESGKEQAELGQQHRSLEEAEKKMTRLIQMGLKELLSDEEFAKEKAALQSEINSLKRAESQSLHHLEKARDGALEVAHFVTHAPVEFASGSPARRREIARQLGAVFELTDGVLTLEINPLLVPLLNVGLAEDKQKPSSSTVQTAKNTVHQHVINHVIEPLKTGSGSRKADVSKSAVPLGWDEGTMFAAFGNAFALLLDGATRLPLSSPR
jgi:site-specific DNA recombinase